MSRQSRTSADWSALLENCPWHAEAASDAEVSGSTTWARPVPAWAPELDRLLRAARVTPVAFDGRAYELLAWDGERGPRGWLCPLPPNEVPAGVHPDHRELLSVFGGTTDAFGGPRSWLDNTNESLTLSLAMGERTLVSVVEAYDWLWTDEDLPLPDVQGYYAVAEEANGNLTACHHTSGRLLLFAGDHDFEHVTVLEGSPEYSLYVLDGLPDLRSWIARVAQQWSSG